MEHLETLTRIFCDVFDDPALTLTEQTGPEQIPDWDSVAQVKLVLLVELEYGFRFQSDDVAKIHCVGDFLTMIDRYLAG